MQHFYHASQYQTATPPPSYWHDMTPPPPDSGSLHELQHCDVAIVGAGLTGLSAALHLARDHGIRVVVVDAGALGWGASGRNAGFNTLPATKLSLAELLTRWGETETRLFLQSQYEGQNLVEAFCTQQQLAIRHGRGSYMVAHAAAAWQGLQEEYALWQRYGPLPCRLLDADSFAEEGHGGPEQHGALHLDNGGGLNPLALVYGLASAAQQHGARLYSHSPVCRLSHGGGHHILHTPDGRIHARHLLFATNAYPARVQPATLNRRQLPAISNIIVTAPLDEQQWSSHGYHTLSPAFDSRHLLHYYRRLPDGRLLFGARGDLSGSPQHGLRQQQALQAAMARKFPAFADCPVDYYWRGLVSVTRSMVPAMGETRPGSRQWYAFGCHGNGINTMPWMGRALARRIAGVRPTATEACAVYQTLPPRLPPGDWLQKLGLQLAYQRYAWLDEQQASQAP